MGIITAAVTASFGSGKSNINVGLCIRAFISDKETMPAGLASQPGASRDNTFSGTDHSQQEAYCTCSR
jgi:hypothetical protein